jgi:hypothetical protein
MSAGRLKYEIEYACTYVADLACGSVAARAGGFP